MPCSPAESDIDASIRTHRYRLAGNLIPDAHLAAIAIEHGLEICSADTQSASGFRQRSSVNRAKSSA